MIMEPKAAKKCSYIIVAGIIIFLLILGELVSGRANRLRSIEAVQDESITMIKEMPEDLNTEYYQGYSTYIIGRKYSGLDVCNIENYFESGDITVYVVPHEDTQGQFSVTFAYIFVGTNEDRTEWYFKQV